MKMKVNKFFVLLIIISFQSCSYKANNELRLIKQCFESMLTAMIIMPPPTKMLLNKYAPILENCVVLLEQKEPKELRKGIFGLRNALADATLKKVIIAFLQNILGVKYLH